ncbi:MAG: NAD-dependent epimerase/dehydratase family protein [Bacteroidetes bacterium]|nr:NAD-dependent epimerase/dehydratase family protein [Bacteroidota bacterium]
MTKSNDANNGLRVLVTGGSGFLGTTIVEEFIDAKWEMDVREIRILDIKEYKGKKDDRITFYKGNVCRYEEINEAFKQIDVVIHSAAIIDWGTKSEKEVYDINFGGTQNVIKACKENHVSALVYVSSLDAVISGSDLIDIDESQPYPAEHPNMYCKSKSLAERLVIGANQDSFKTCAMRPADIYGEGDPYHIPPLLDMVKNGFYLHIGDGSAKCQHIYVRNMAWAILLAAKALVENNHQVPGNVYFITDGPGSNFFTFFDNLITQSGYKIWPRNFRLSRRVAYLLGSISEYVALLVRPIKYYNPKLSRFAVMYISTEFTFTSAKANRDFGFQPKYSVQQALENTTLFFRREIP